MSWDRVKSAVLGGAFCLAFLGFSFNTSNITSRFRQTDPIIRFNNNVTDIVKYLTQGNGKGLGWSWLANLTDTFGHRKIGSKGFDAALSYNQKTLKSQGFSNVHTEDVANLANWTRGLETATLLKPRLHQMRILGIGGTGPTPKGGLTAEAVVVTSFAELAQLGKTVVSGKIVVFNQPWVDYGTSVAYRSGAAQAVKYGAVATLIRSVTSFSVYSPHTGMGAIGANNVTIPTACITVEDAKLLWRMQERGEKLSIQIVITSGTKGTITSQNQIFELPGTELPSEIVMLSGHFDSWDVGTGAMDDGGGIAVMWAALNAIKNLKLKLKRTIRVIFWTAEEEGHLGAQYYYNQHKTWKNESFFFVSESDEGVFRSTSKKASMLTRTSNATFLRQLQSIGGLLNAQHIPLSVTNSTTDLGDAEPWAKDGIPGFIYMNMESHNLEDMYDHYFIFHHTEADTMTVLSKEDIDYTAAIFASFAYVLANI